MNRQHFFKTGIFLYAGILFLPALYSQNNPRLDFIKGDIKAKTAAVKEAAEKGDYSLCIKGMDFAMENAELLLNDEDTIALLNESILSIQKNSLLSDSDVSSKLCDVFKTYTSDTVKENVISRFKTFPSNAAVSIVNAYISQAIQNSVPMTQTVRTSIQFLKTNGNTTSFRLLFVADVLDVWNQEHDFIAGAWGPLANNSESEILQLLSGADMDEKLAILNAVKENPYVLKKIKGEVAENALSEAIYNVDDSSQSVIKLQLASFKLISDSMWTRASSLSLSYFQIAKKEYESGYITALDFCSVIEGLTHVATAKTGEVLSQYLDLLNRSMEAKSAPEKVVVLSVINALGGLGDKTAFDSLLYVTYLEYPEEVISCARNALAKLKW